MVSRRSVRVKVMQLLYALDRDKKLTTPEILKRYDEAVENAFDLFLFNLYIFVNTAYQAVEDASKRHSKYLPSEEDQNFTDKLYTNPLVTNLAENDKLESEYRKLGFQAGVDEDVFRKLYEAFADTEEYRMYLASDPSDTADRKVLLDLYRLIRKHDFFNEVVEDHFPHWPDDKSLAVGTVKKAIKALPADQDFYEVFYPDRETAFDFGKSLLRNACDHNAELVEMIEPTLRNWDLERLAILDMILLKMAICEFLYFPTIPTKVTLNEYVEIAKTYSTPKSKDFINGILDRLMKLLESEGKINKSGRGLQE